MWLERDGDGFQRLQCVQLSNPITGVDDLFEELFERVHPEPQRRWLIDLTGILFVNSRSLATLIATARRVHDAGGRICLVHVHQFVSTVLKTTRIIKLVPVFDIEADAIAFLT